jgi:hypothetical protein
VRIRLDLGFIDQHRWVEDREGGILKPSCSRGPVALSTMDCVTFLLVSTHPEQTR